MIGASILYIMGNMCKLLKLSRYGLTKQYYQMRVSETNCSNWMIMQMIIGSNLQLHFIYMCQHLAIR
jgi:hypothetical protein